MARHKDKDWTLADNVTYEVAQLAVLMDLRDELKELNRTLSCFRVRRMSDDINRIDKRLQVNGMLAIKRRAK